MGSFILIFILLSGFSLQPQKATIESSDLNEAAKLHAEAVRLYKEDKFAEALNSAKKVVELREKTLPQNDALLAASYTNLGYIFRSLGKYYEAEKALKKALKIEENRLGKEQADLAELLTSIGWLLHAQNNAMDAEAFFKRAVAVTEKSFGADHKEVAEQIYHLARFYEKTSKIGKAIPLFDRMVMIKVKAFGEISKETKEAVELNACALQQNNQPTEAELQWKRSYTIERGLHPIVGEVESGVLQGLAMKRVQPIYPDYAKAAKVQGTVIVHVLIDEAGNVEEAKTLCGPDLLANGSVEAARQWKFKPMELKGKPVKVQGRLQFNFSLK